MWSKIVNPNTGRKVNLNNKLGQNILKKYIKQLGGNLIGRHSPIDIEPTGHIIRKDDILNIEYSEINIDNIELVHNSNYNFNVNDKSKIINWNNKKFRLIQFHFHNTSEHMLNGKKYDMEVHLVHKSLDSDNLLVIGLFIESSPNLNMECGVFDTAIRLEKKSIKLNNILMNKFHNYKGSLTTKPYSLIVDWIVFDKPIYTLVSKSEINKIWNNLASARNVNYNVGKNEILTFE